MTNLGSLLPSAQDPRSTPVLTSQSLEESGPELLELRTANGVVYVRPSRWQRIRLQWTFRNFHVLAPQVLSRRDRRLIEKLSQSAVVTPARPVAGSAVFGVIEEARSRVSSDSAVAHRRKPAATKPILGISRLPGLPSTPSSAGVNLRETRGPGFQQWGALGALAAVCFAVILASGYGIVPVSNRGKTGNPPKPATSIQPMQQAANHVRPVSLQPVASKPLPVPLAAPPLPGLEKPKRRVAPPPSVPTLVGAQPPLLADVSGQLINPLNGKRSKFPPLQADPGSTLEPATLVPPSPSERRFVAEFPQGHVAYPVVGEPDLVGEVQLQALVGADGSVKEVTLLSGSPKLGEVGMRAVRQWHYSPYRVLGSPVEVETKIKMNFFGQDAVSIASVADKANAQVK